MGRKISVVLSLVFIFLVYGCAFALDLEAGSKIKEVTVYPDSALVTRVASLKLDSGEQKVAFSNIIPDIDENSLRVSGEGNADFKILGAQVKKEFLEEAPQERVRLLQEEIQKLQTDKKRLLDSKEVILREREFLDSVRLFSREQIPKDLITKMPSIKDLDDTLKFLDVKFKENYSQIIDLELNIKEIEKKIEALNNQLREISASTKKLQRSIVVDVSVTKPGNLDLSVAYLVKGATWQPLYDARANFAKSEVELISYGLIKQKSGEDWLNTELALSTAKPALGGRMPYVSPWFIKPYQPPVYEKSGGLGILKARAQKEAFYNVEARDDTDKLSQPTVSYATAEEKGIAVVYKLSRLATIKADGSEQKLPVSSQILKGDFAYSTYPRLTPYVYLGSRVSNAKELQLLAGRVNIFLDGDFVGTSGIDNIGPGEEFDLYLGVDENVKVKREEIQKKVDDVLIANIPAPNRKTTFKYKLTLENYKNKKVKVILFEAVPVSQDERIKVNVTNVSLQPKDKDWKDRKGVWRWELELEPKAKQEIFYTYTVEHPRDMQVEGI